MKFRNSKPKGIKPIKLTASIGNWVRMQFDAYIVRNGIRWLRVKGGMSGNNDREDWVADLPEVCISVSDYNWDKRLDFGTCYGSFEKAILGIVKEESVHVERKVLEYKFKSERLLDVARRLKEASK